jgi:prepilin-type N-terminal cleavage/methylation domain-containing protein
MIAHPAENDGFTLIEVLVAFAILSLVVIASFRIFADGVQRVTAVEQRLAEAAIAQSLVDEFRQYGQIQPRPGFLVSVEKVSSDAVDWTTIQPHRIRIAHSRNPEVPLLETIIMRDQGRQ